MSTGGREGQLVREMERKQREHSIFEGNRGVGDTGKRHEKSDNEGLMRREGAERR